MAHLQRRIDHQAGFREGFAQHLGPAALLGLPVGAGFPGPGVQAHQLRGEQEPKAPACWPPGGAVPQAAGGTLPVFQLAASGVGAQLKLGQVPITGQGGQPVLGRGHESHPRAQQFRGQGHRPGFGQQRGRGPLGLGQSQPFMGRPSGWAQGRPGLAPDAVLGVADPQPAGVGIAQGRELHGAGGCAWREFGHDAVHGQTRLFEGLQVGAQPGAVARSHPRAGGVGPVSLQGQMHLLGVVQQTVFQQTLQGRLHALGLFVQTCGQLDAVPRQRRSGHQGDGFGLAIGGG